MKYKAIKSLLKSIIKRFRELNIAIRTVLAVPVDGDDYVFLSSGYPRLCLPHDRQLIRENKAKMEQAGWELLYGKDEHEAGDWYPYGVYRKGKMKIELTYFDHKEGSVCKRVKIGTETKEEPIYEFQCVDTLEDK